MRTPSLTSSDAVVLTLPHCKQANSVHTRGVTRLPLMHTSAFLAEACMAITGVHRSCLRQEARK